MSQILQFKITLKHIEPKIWRRFLVRDTITFADMHHIIQTVMGWEDDHLHQFALSKYDYIGNVGQMPGEVEDERKIPVKKIFGAPKVKITYEYDFGDGWEHELILEKILEEEKGMKYPHCVKGENSCPPEDCGGPWGFADMMEKLKAADSEEKEELLEWLGDDYDPSSFDLVDINKQLSRFSKK
jgi:hypothetical protein